MASTKVQTDQMCKRANMGTGPSDPHPTSRANFIFNPPTKFGCIMDNPWQLIKTMKLAPEPTLLGSHLIGSFLRILV